MNKQFSEERVNRIMESLDGIKKEAAPDFFYTRLKGKMQPAEKQGIFLLRPAFITAVLALFLIVNVFSLFEMSKTKQPGREDQQPGIESFAKAYNLSSGSLYE